MKTFQYRIFRRIAKTFSGHGLRRKIPFVNQLFIKLNSRLSISSTQVMGNIMFLDSGDSMGLSVNGFYELEETKLVRELIKPGFTVLDLGANIGYFTLLFADLVGPEGCVYAFEPHPKMYDLLQRNIKANGYQHAFAFQLAVSDHSGSLTLFVDPFYNLDHRIYFSDDHVDGIDIEVVRVDDFLLSVPYVDFIKMDIQGAEMLALSGMLSLINRSPHPILLTEFWPDGLRMSGSSAKQFFQELKELDFKVFDIGSNSYLNKETSLVDLMDSCPINSNKHTNLLCRR